MLRKILFLASAVIVGFGASAQQTDSGKTIWDGRLPKIAVKTNLLYDATSTLNLGVEFGLGRRTSLDVPINYNPWSFPKGRKLKHLMVQPEFRYWFCERFNGSFLGVHALGGIGNTANLKIPFGLWDDLEGHRYQGWFVGAGLSYGYQWYLGPHWNLEATIGGGYIYFNYDKYECGKCGNKLLNDKDKHYFGVTKAGLSLVYLFKYKKQK